MTLAYFCSAVFSVALLSLLHTWKEEKNSWKSNAVAHSGRERQLGFAWPQWKITAVLCSVIHSRSHRIKESGYNRSRELNSAGIVHSWLWPVAFRLLPPSPRDSFPPHFCDLLFQSPRIFQLWVAEGEVHEPEYWIHNYQNNPSSSSSCSRLLSPVYWFRAAFQKKKKALRGMTSFIRFSQLRWNPACWTSSIPESAKRQIGNLCKWANRNVCFPFCWWWHAHVVELLTVFISPMMWYTHDTRSVA